MITDNPMFKKMLQTGEEQFGKLASQLVANEKFIASLQGAVTRALEAKGILDRQVTTALSAMHVPTTQDMQKLNDRLDELERIFEGLSSKVDAIAAKLDERA
jgi:polyhydroxyalkanoate synthesis regulator phasin